jgi:serine protease Do
MKKFLGKLKTFTRHSAVASALALAMIGSLGIYELARPAAAKSAVIEPTATPLDDHSVSALLSLDQAMETLAARVTPAVVNVAVTSRHIPDMQNLELPPGLQQFSPFFGPDMPKLQPTPQVEHGIGSGVLISPDGYIVTNAHVVEHAVDIHVTTSDKRVWTAKLLGTDPLTDIAVIKIPATGLPNLPWGNSTDLHPGQTVLAFGNPMGLRFTVTRGIISALNRPNPFSEDGRKPGAFIQTDAAINPGNSGGALVDARGQLVGINTFLVSSNGGFSGMGFAIPTQIVKPTVESLIRNGKVTRGYMGVGITDVTPDNAKFFDLKDTNGAVVTQVGPGSPGARAGLKVGDVIKAIDGKPVADAGQLQLAIQQARPDQTVRLEVLRDGQSMNVPITLEAMNGNRGGEQLAGSEQGKARWGIGIADLTPETRSQMQVPNNVQGAVVGSVQPGSPADDAGLSRGEVIEQVNRKPVKSAAEVKNALSSIPQGQDALVLVWSNGGSTFRVLHAPEASS